MARLMIVDDTPFMRNIIMDICKSEGHDIIAEAATGLEAVEQYQNFRPDLTIMDITMPVMDGLQALQRIKEYDPGALVILCSTRTSQKQIMEALKLGAKDFIMKPIQKGRVIDSINSVLFKINPEAQETYRQIPASDLQPNVQLLLPDQTLTGELLGIEGELMEVRLSGNHSIDLGLKIACKYLNQPFTGKMLRQNGEFIYLFVPLSSDDTLQERRNFPRFHVQMQGTADNGVMQTTMELVDLSHRGFGWICHESQFNMGHNCILHIESEALSIAPKVIIVNKNTTTNGYRYGTIIQSINDEDYEKLKEFILEKQLKSNKLNK